MERNRLLMLLWKNASLKIHSALHKSGIFDYFLLVNPHFELLKQL